MYQCRYGHFHLTEADCRCNFVKPWLERTRPERTLRDYCLQCGCDGGAEGFYHKEREMKEEEKFPARVVLGEGWPRLWSMGGTSLNHEFVTIQTRRGKSLSLGDLPQEFEDDDCPKYRLILERVD